jgi:ATP-dependent Clp protease ATP-binding subunit ClpA
MATFSRTLETSLRRSLALANQQHHESVTTEHMLLALVDDPDASASMVASNIELAKLRSRLTTHLESQAAIKKDWREGDTARPTTSFQRVLQRAMLRVDASGVREVSGANVIASLLSESESAACGFLQEQNMN